LLFFLANFESRNRIKPMKNLPWGRIYGLFCLVVILVFRENTRAGPLSLLYFIPSPWIFYAAIFLPATASCHGVA
jgi:hypothetical protein